MAFFTGTPLISTEEAGHVLYHISGGERLPIQILTYAAPDTRKMLQFNDFNYHSVPTLPADWEVPAWLLIELDIFAGRLYFDFSEYSLLCDYLGSRGDNLKVEEIEIEEDSGLVGTNDEQDEVVEEGVVDNDTKVFCKKPFMFLQEWLALRRKG